MAEAAVNKGSVSSKHTVSVTASHDLLGIVGTHMHHSIWSVYL